MYELLLPGARSASRLGPEYRNAYVVVSRPSRRRLLAPLLTLALRPCSPRASSGASRRNAWSARHAQTDSPRCPSRPQLRLVPVPGRVRPRRGRQRHPRHERRRHVRHPRRVPLLSPTDDLTATMLTSARTRPSRRHVPHLARPDRLPRPRLGRRPRRLRPAPRAWHPSSSLTHSRQLTVLPSCFPSPSGARARRTRSGRSRPGTTPTGCPTRARRPTRRRRPARPTSTAPARPPAPRLVRRPRRRCPSRRRSRAKTRRRRARSERAMLSRGRRRAPSPLTLSPPLDTSPLAQACPHPFPSLLSLFPALIPSTRTAGAPLLHHH